MHPDKRVKLILGRKTNALSLCHNCLEATMISVDVPDEMMRRMSLDNFKHDTGLVSDYINERFRQAGLDTETMYAREHQ